VIESDMSDSTNTDIAAGGTWDSLKNRIFATLLLVNLFATMAVFMNGLAAAWVLTDITDSPAVVASLQFALAVPAFLLALFAGALADIVSRKTIIVIGQSGSLSIAATFALLSASDANTIGSVLGMTAALGAFTALAAPAWIAIVPGLVRRSDLAGAMTLSSAGVSGAMTVGPAIAGLVIAATGPTAVFILNVCVFTAGLFALRVWQPTPQSGLPAEHLVRAMRLGLQYVRYDRPLKAVIGKIVPFAFTATALIALLPAVARFRLGAGPVMFGLISGAGGIGAVLGLLAMPRIRRRIGPDTVVLSGMFIQAAVLLVMAMTDSLIVAFVALAAAGAAGLAIVSTVMTVLQIVLPAWIRGRGIAVYLLALQGSFAIGALVWGAVAEQTSLQTTLIAASFAMVAGSLLTAPLRLGSFMITDAKMAQLIDDPPAVTSVHDDDGPIFLTVNWEIEPAKQDDFISAMQPVRRALKRQGALSFHLVEDVENPGRMTESFTVATWSEYRRLPQRSTMDDKDTHDALISAVGHDLPTVTVHRELGLNRQKPSTTSDEHKKARNVKDHESNQT
jgi:MFS family permease